MRHGSLLPALMVAFLLARPASAQFGGQGLPGLAGRPVHPGEAARDTGRQLREGVENKSGSSTTLERGDVSDDSRYWGDLPRRDIIGRAVACYWLPARCQVLR